MIQTNTVLADYSPLAPTGRAQGPAPCGRCEAGAGAPAQEPLAVSPKRTRTVPGSGRPGSRRETPVIEFLRQCPLVFGIDDKGLEQVGALCELKTFNAREQVFAEGEADDGLWVLLSGRVRLYHSDPEGRQLVVSFPEPLSPLDLAALDGRPHTVGAATLERCQILFVSQAARLTIAGMFPGTVGNLLRQLSRDLRQRDISHAVLSFRSARGRISCALLQLAIQYGVRRPGSVKIDYRLTRQDLADRAGVTLETSIRVLSDLQQRGVVATSARVIEILDQDQLETWSGCDDCELDCSIFARPAAAEASLPVSGGLRGPGAAFNGTSWFAGPRPVGTKLASRS